MKRRLETSASESLYGGQFTLSTQLIKPNYLYKHDRGVELGSTEKRLQIFKVVRLGLRQRPPDFKPGYGYFTAMLSPRYIQK